MPEFKRYPYKSRFVMSDADVCMASSRSSTFNPRPNLSGPNHDEPMPAHVLTEYPSAQAT